MKKIVFAIVFFLTFQLAPATRAQNSDEVLRASLLEQIKVLLEQIITLQKALAEKSNNDGLKSIILSSTAVVEARYRVYNPADFSWINNTQREVLMERFVKLTPDHFDERLDEFVFFIDEATETDAFVETLNGTDSWRVGFSKDFASHSVQDKAATDLLVHEIGHIISYEEAINKTPLGSFEDEFWGRDRNQYEFVSEYAQKSVEEDFAESFMKYVLTDGSYRGIAVEKVHFFNRYPILRQYRLEIRSNI